jgi:hypothetical protein
MSSDIVKDNSPEEQICLLNSLSHGVSGHIEFALEENEQSREQLPLPAATIRLIPEFFTNEKTNGISQQHP